MLSFNTVRDPRPATVSHGLRAFFSKAAFAVVPLTLASSFFFTPSVSLARITPAQLALHNARLAQRQARGHDWIALSKPVAAISRSAAKAKALHNARLAKLTAAHRHPAIPAALAAHNARLAKIQALRRGRLSLAASATEALILKQQTQHKARLAKMLAAKRAHAATHNARLAKALAKHQAQMAAHQAKLLARLRNAQTRQAKLQAKSAQKYAKLHQQHVALTSGNVVEAAYAFRGSRYVMGGTSRSGFDCSGFVRYILSNAGGVDMPRTATEQFYHGTPIAPDAMQPGDLVFFKNTYKHGISHVGIYAGDGKFIHAANSHKGVRMDSLSDKYYVAHFAGARRVLPAQMRAAASLGQ